MTQNIKQLRIYTSLFQVVSLWFDTTPPALIKSLEPVGVEFFRLFWNSFGVAAWISSSHVKWTHFKCFLRPVNDRSQTMPKPGRRVYNIFNCDRLYRRWSGRSSWDLALSDERNWFVLSTTLGSSRKTRIWFFYLDDLGLLLVNNASVVLQNWKFFPAECWLLIFFFFWEM